MTALQMKQRFQAAGDLLDRYRQVFGFAWAQRKKMEPRKLLPEEAEFLPAALSLQQTPVSPLPRVTMWLMIAFALSTLAWSVFGRIDIVATGQGKVVPGNRVKTIQPLETAMVKRILVSDGQVVRVGQVLVEFDATTVSADVSRVGGELSTAYLQGARAEALLAALRPLESGRVSAPPRLGPAPGAAPNDRAQAQALLDAQYAELRSKLARIESDIDRREAEHQSVSAMVRKLEQTAPIARQRAQDYKRLVEENFVSQHGYLEREQARIELEADLVAQRSRLREIDASLREARAQHKAMVAEAVRAALDGASEARQKSESLRQEHIKADSRAGAMTLVSPVDGVVQQLAIHTVGGVVTPAQPLMVIVPRDDALEVEAFIENKDIGFVHAGQDAAVKVETFEYTKFGVIPAKVTHVSNDALQDEKRGLIYSMHVKLSEAAIQVEGKKVNLSPGMAVAVEVKTGKRRVIEYFLSPLLQHANESLKER
ncbi:HlyD family type I secretion periplasmic adaptor subunit [Variovorax sp. JS1663]|uniref:HlyD family type I secretion periplasmic adaptor subunit n=1 Tax=Variovorax sp. JS1663 TaxID=1851577 RepID=UPI000B345D64|nr:HlyD family type I secretion periplasmic adaptor subunit [Variovorax sp. JS1663]OUL98746.1 hemolysin secretion protein D [Variovorax sp. JS1663]